MEDYFFSKLCWVCLAEEKNMHSLRNERKIQIDNIHSPVSLSDLLSYVISSEIFFSGGPYLICNNCKTQASAAYKFKKRCEITLKIFQKSKLLPCTRDAHLIKHPLTLQEQTEHKITEENDNNIEVVIKQEEPELYLEDHNTIKTEPTIEEDALLNSINVGDHAVYLIVGDGAEPTIPSCSDISYLSDPIAENARLPHPGPKDFLCTICGLQKSRSSIRQHMHRHANVKNYACPFCEKKFNDKGNLNVHVRIHTGVHPYVCDVCGKKFIQATGLKTHKRMHDDIKPYKCHICTYSTRTSSHLQLHIKRHIGVKNYHCTQCDYSACSNAELKYHLAKHSNDKCHVCETCGKGFTRYKGLKTHEKSHTGEKPHICELCGRGFTQAHSLRTHLKNIHKKID